MMSACPSPLKSPVCTSTQVTFGFQAAQRLLVKEEPVEAPIHHCPAAPNRPRMELGIMTVRPALPRMEFWLMSVTVIDWLPVVLRVTVKEWTPLSPLNPRVKV